MRKSNYLWCVLAVIMAVVFSISLTACGGGDDDGISSPPNQGGNGGNQPTVVRVECKYCQGTGKCYNYGTGCNGTGICKNCNGTGEPSYYDSLIHKTKCSMCNGDGKCTTCHGSGICNHCEGSGYLEETTSGGDSSGGGTTDYFSTRALKITWIISIDNYSQTTENMYKRTVDGTVYLYTSGKSLKGRASRNSDRSCGPYSVSSYSYKFFSSSSTSITYYYFN